jgi:hypothetical protein
MNSKERFICAIEHEKPDRDIEPIEDKVNGKGVIHEKT